MMDGIRNSYRKWLEFCDAFNTRVFFHIVTSVAIWRCGSAPEKNYRRMARGSTVSVGQETRT
jgi:hypothetical protein